ncbi:hypothetical protein [Corynebacterium timonense]|uniref:Uncharacterized protein n=1 Tax=Corynebacterium timonense TaxID=441500 RepID=A0A1H1QCP1_9CORY|nr:hypothetical protein [Corynebacterium timonense]SDS21200.1 hypothetical protein SAMN04488539_1232 [Corynebacterium timonense]
MTQPRWLAAAGVAAASVVFAVGVSLIADGIAVVSAADDRPAVTIGVEPRSPEQLVLGEIYQQLLLSQGRQADVVALTPADELGWGEVSFAVTCTGTALRHFDARGAEELRAQLADEADGESTPSEETYAAAVGVMPGHVMTVDPSPAEGCGGSHEGALPENIIPVFQKALFTRGERQGINSATRALDTDDVAEMAENVAGGTEPQEAVAEWLQEYMGIRVSDRPSVGTATEANQPPAV